MKGISARNLKYMRAFAEAYPEFVLVPVQTGKEQFVQQPAAQIGGQILQEPLAKKTRGKLVQPPVAQTGNKQIVQPVVAQLNEEQNLQQAIAQITWSHNVVLLDRVKNAEERLFYARQTSANGWSRNMLVHQIESGLYGRKGAAVTNFHATLPKPQSDLAHELLKDP